MLGPLLAMPRGQGLNMTLLAILKVNGANWLLVLEKNWSCGKMFLLLTRYHYWLDNIINHSQPLIIGILYVPGDWDTLIASWSWYHSVNQYQQNGRIFCRILVDLSFSAMECRESTENVFSNWTCCIVNQRSWGYPIFRQAILISFFGFVDEQESMDTKTTVSMGLLPAQQKLVGGLEHCFFPILGISSSQLTNSIIFRVGLNHQPVYVLSSGKRTFTQRTGKSTHFSWVNPRTKPPIQRRIP